MNVCVCVYGGGGGGGGTMPDTAHLLNMYLFYRYVIYSSVCIVYLF